MSKEKSQCCGVEKTVISADEGTSFYGCSKCEKQFIPQETSLKEHKTFTEECYNHPKCMKSLKVECKCVVPKDSAFSFCKHGNIVPNPNLPSSPEKCKCNKEGCAYVYRPAPSLEWDWEKEFEKKFPPWIAMEKYEGFGQEIFEFIHKVESNALARGREETLKSCPPHNFIPHRYVGNWGGSVPPPNMKCTKCLLEQYF